MPLKEDKNKINCGLYVVSTPIGNLRDISLRALDVLAKSEVILCEDTRISKKLLTHYKINSKLISHHKFNEKKNLDKIIELLKEEKIVSMISDAGTPSISDPGRILINSCIQENISIIPRPGPSAVTASVSISGFSEKFYFHGFLPDKESAIKKDFELFKNYNCSIVFFISAQKLIKRLDLIKNYFVGRQILICREITKIHESFYRGNVSEITNLNFNPKGEVTVIISEDINNIKKETDLDESDKKKIKKLILNKSVKDIVRIFTKEKNISKSKIYNYCLSVKNEK